MNRGTTVTISDGTTNSPAGEITSALGETAQYRTWVWMVDAPGNIKSDRDSRIGPNCQFIARFARSKLIHNFQGAPLLLRISIYPAKDKPTCKRAT